MKSFCVDLAIELHNHHDIPMIANANAESDLCQFAWAFSSCVPVHNSGASGYQVGYVSRALEAIYRLHKGPIWSIAGLKDSVGERPCQSNFADQNSVRIMSEFCQNSGILNIF